MELRQTQSHLILQHLIASGAVREATVRRTLREIVKFYEERLHEVLPQRRRRRRRSATVVGKQAAVKAMRKGHAKRIDKLERAIKKKRTPRTTGPDRIKGRASAQKGRYMGLLNTLDEAGKEKIKTLYRERGIRAALKEAERLRAIREAARG